MKARGSTRLFSYVTWWKLTWPLSLAALQILQASQGHTSGDIQITSAAVMTQAGRLRITGVSRGRKPDSKPQQNICLKRLTILIFSEAHSGMILRHVYAPLLLKRD
ncbi:hypothetical protein F5B18DRAFT_140648 [Nemania serpens]|nr:hypothetical protein F5B18DRAFT_140648 [Nemania serpens]